MTTVLLFQNINEAFGTEHHQYKSMYVCICQGMYFSTSAQAYNNKSAHPQYHKAPPTPFLAQHVWTWRDFLSLFLLVGSLPSSFIFVFLSWGTWQSRIGLILHRVASSDRNKPLSLNPSHTRDTQRTYTQKNDTKNKSPPHSCNFLHSDGQDETWERWSFAVTQRTLLIGFNPRPGAVLSATGSLHWVKSEFYCHWNFTKMACVPRPLSKTWKVTCLKARSVGQTGITATQHSSFPTKH